jgi:hypothetical protein
MSLFGLGSFGEGFVTGFATEANEALKKSVNRINTRVDKLKDFQVQRAIKEQDKRASEVEEHKEALQQAYALFDGDENAEQAIAYAGGLLKERGGLAAFKTKIAELQEAKDNGTNIFNYFERATTDAPFNATLDDIANAAVGGRSTTATDYRLPEGMGDDSSLVGTILGKKIDIVGMAMEQSSQEIGALYGASVDQLVSLPTITFKSEEFSLSSKTPAEILDYANKKLATPTVRNNPEAVTRYESMRDAQEKAVVATKDQQATLNIINARLNRLPLDQKGTDIESDLLRQRQEIKDKIKLTSLEGDPVGILEHQKTIALRKAVAEAGESGKPVDMTEVDALTEKINTLSGVVKTEAEEVAEDREALNKRTDPTYTGLDKIDTSTPEGQALYEKEINLINAREAVLNQNASPKAIDARDVTFFEKSILDAFAFAKDNFSDTLDLNTRTAWNRITNLIAGSKDPIAQLARLESEDPEGLRIYREVELARDNLRPNFIANYLKGYDRKLNPEVFSAAANLGYVEPEDQAAVSEAVSSGQDASAQTAAALDGDAPADVTPVAPTSATIAEGNKLRRTYPDTAEGAERLLNVSLAAGVPIEKSIEDARLKGYKNPAFFSIFEIATEKGQDPAIAKMAIEDAGMEGEPDSDVTYATSKQVSALDVIRKMPILQQGSQNLKIRTLSSKLDISQDEAKNILESLDSAIYSPQDEVKIAKDIVDSIIGTDYREIKVIAKELNIPMDYARRLHKQVTGNSAATGGLMARK